jgi:NAD(P)-dependent dehydrogenase (short-subunit alcohol dehydrogenase family)
MQQLRGTNALITGGAGGLGHYIARALAAEGVNMVLSDLPDVPLMGDLADELRARGITIEVVSADLTQRAEAEQLIARAERALGPLDVLVNVLGDLPRLRGPRRDVRPARVRAAGSTLVLEAVPA